MAIYLATNIMEFSLVRFCSINNCVKGFINDVKDLARKLVHQGFNKAALRSKFVKFCNNKLNLWGKYGMPYEST